MYKNILFDLDGTLLDTTSGVTMAIRKTLQTLHCDILSDEILKNFVGPPMQESFEKYLKCDKNEALKNANIFREIYKNYLHEAKPYDGILMLLKELESRKIKIAIATNKSHNNAINILEKFGILKYCHFVMGSDLEGKLTKIDIVNICLKELGAHPQDSVLIGDSIVDSDGALENHIDFIAVLYGFGFKSTNDLQGIKHVAYFKDVLAMSKFLLGGYPC